MFFIYAPEYEIDIGPHVFPTEKYRRIADQLRSERIVSDQNIRPPSRPSREDLAMILDPAYLDDLLAARMTMRTARSELPVKMDIIAGQILAAGGSVKAAELARECGAAFHIGGGFHHAFPDHAEGFCYLNDIALAAVKMLTAGVRKIAVVDCDLHQGNGTARYFETEDRVFTFSIHQENLYPLKQRSDLDIGLENGTGDAEYLAKLSGALDQIIDGFKPEFVIYQCGADPYLFDQLGDLRLTIDGLGRRDEMVIGRCRNLGIPLIAVLGGGYAEQLDDTVEIHCNTARIMARFD
jgi:acetoin utilization deacetylase AcuC-like enzyme